MSDPCNQASDGFSSGFLFVPGNTTASEFPTWNLTILSTDRTSRSALYYSFYWRLIWFFFGA